MNSTNNRAAVFRRDDVILDEKEDFGFGTAFFGLRDVDVHFIAVKICVVGATDLKIEAKSAVGHDTDLMSHNGHSVEGGLAIEEDYIAITEVAFDSIARFEIVGEEREIGDVTKVEAAAIGTDDVIDAREGLRTLENQLLHVFDIPLGDAFGDGENASDFLRDTDFVNGEVGIGANDSASGKINAFTG